MKPKTGVQVGERPERRFSSSSEGKEAPPDPSCSTIVNKHFIAREKKQKNTRRRLLTREAA